jgi:hypothetical protein
MPGVVVWSKEIHPNSEPIMSTTTLVSDATLPTKQTLNGMLSSTHDAWMLEADRFLTPVTDPYATFWERWGAVRFLADQFPERFELEEALLNELQAFVSAEMRERLWMQLERLTRLQKDLDAAATERGNARQVASLTRQLLDALRLWYAEIEFAIGDVRESDLTPRGAELMSRLAGKPAFSCAVIHEWAPEYA